MKDEQISRDYNRLLEETLAKYRGRTFIYNLDIPVLKDPQTLVGISNSRLEFRDADGTTSHMSIDQFLRDTIELAPEKPAEPRTVIEIEADQAEREQKQPFRRDDGYVHPNKKD
jgi:hypothetical protein